MVVDQDDFDFNDLGDEDGARCGARLRWRRPWTVLSDAPLWCFLFFSEEQCDEVHQDAR